MTRQGLSGSGPNLPDKGTTWVAPGDGSTWRELFGAFEPKQILIYLKNGRDNIAGTSSVGNDD